MSLPSCGLEGCLNLQGVTKRITGSSEVAGVNEWPSWSRCPYLDLGFLTSLTLGGPYTTCMCHSLYP